MSRCPRCGGRVDDGLFAICPRCGATPGATGDYGTPQAQTSAEDGGAPGVFGAPPGAPRIAGTLLRLVMGLIVVGAVVAIGVAIFSATVGETDDEGPVADTGPVVSVATAEEEPVASTAADTAPAAATEAAPAARSEASCTRLWNAAVNEGARDGVAALGATGARVRASRDACVVVAIIPGDPPTATRFVAEDRVYGPEGPAARVPEPNARLDASGRLRRQ